MKLSIYQLKQNAAAMIAFADGLPIQFIAANSDRWVDYLHTDMMPDFANRPFRPKPQPVSRPWSKPEDVPLHCWIRLGAVEPERLVIMVVSNGIRIAGTSCHSAFFEWRELSALDHSTDRKTWHPCTVEDAQ